MSTPEATVPTPVTATSKRERSESPDGGDGTPGPAKRLNTGSLAEDANESAKMGSKEESKDGVVPMDISTSLTTPSDSTSLPSQPKPEVTEPAAAAAAESSAPPAKDPASLTIQMRSLIVTSDASVIIGKGGANVNEIRDKSNAKVNVSPSIPGNPERILTVDGPLDAVSKAFGLIVRRINDEPFEQASLPGSRAVTIKFIISNSRMGSVIGKAGSKIKEIQEASGARLNASESMLPGSTDRILSVAGVADAVHIAVYYIGTILLEFQERNGDRHSHDRSGQYRQGGGSGGDSYRPGGGGGGGDRYGAPGGGVDRRLAGSGDVYAQPPAGQASQQFWIPNELVGSIIGKGGAKINEIRSSSQCVIRVTDPGTPATPGGPVNPNERLVILQGTPGNIHSAVGMLHSRLEQEKQKKAEMAGMQ